MSNGQNIIDKILADANAEAEQIVATAKTSADKIIAEAKTKADKKATIFMAMAKEEAAKASAKEISSNEMLAKKMLLEEKQKLIAEVISEARQKLSSLTETEYKVILTAMLAKAAGTEKKSEIIFSKEDKAKFSEEFSKMGYKISDEEREIDGGFVVKEGDIEYNYSFDSIISVDKENIEQLTAQILF